MPRHTILSNGHAIEVLTTGCGPEWVSYDGSKESSKFSLFGGDHVFLKEEDGQKAQYDVSIRSGLISGSVTVRKNGVIIYTNR